MIGKPSDDSADTLVQQRHGRRTVDEIGKGLHQFLPKSRLQRSEGPKLKQRHSERGVVKPI